MRPSAPLRFAAALALLALGAACDSPSGSGGPPVPAGLAHVSGDDQEGSGGAPLPNPLVVRVVDSSGVALSGVSVTWEVVTGGGTVTPAASTTGTDGTASTVWTLGSAGGEETARAVAGSLPPVDFSARSRGAGAIVLNVRLPAAQAVVGDTVRVAASVVSSPSSINSFTARVLDRVVTLVPSGNESTGNLVLTGIPSGPLTLRVRATAVSGDSGVVDVPIVLDRAPRLSVDAPVMNTVARPELRIDVDCLDEPPGCTSVTVTALTGEPPHPVLATGTTGIHTTVSLAAFDGRTFFVEVVGTDARGRTDTIRRRVYVEASPRWSEIATAGARMLDTDAQRLLFIDTAGAVRIRVRTNGAETVLLPADPGRLAREPHRGWLHPQGAFFTDDGAIHDWRGGVLEAIPGSPQSVRVDGSWAAWHVPGALGTPGVYLRNLVSGATIFRASAAFHSPDVAANGDLVFVDGQAYEVVRYRAGVATTLTSDDNALFWNTAPVTDGINVVFTKRTPCCSNERYQVAMITATGAELVLTPQFEREPLYAANGGWVAFSGVDAGGIPQVWVRSPAGIVQQATFSGPVSPPVTLRSLGPDGEVVYSAGIRMYVTTPPYTAAPVDIGAVWLNVGATASGQATPQWRSDGLNVFLGRSAFSVSY